MRTTLFYSFLVGVLFSPLFLFAQTASTTGTTTPALTPEQIALQQQVDDLTQQRDSLLTPSTANISANLLLQNLEVKVSPQNPGPSESISVVVESYIDDLDKASFSWVLDGVVAQKGIGTRSFVFQNGPSGKTTRLNINITTQNGESITKSLSWTPIGLTILWQADTYTPPFYRGKALLTAQAAVKVTAIPDNSSSKNALGAGNLAYVWKQDGTSVTSASGYGKNSFTFPAPIPSKTTSVKVLASSMNGSASTEKQINLSLSEPFILFYENSPLLGVWYNQPIGSSYSLSKKEFTVSAVPYFFSNTHTDNAVVSYDWTINGAPVNNIGPSITLRNSAGLAGDSLVTLAANGITKVFQSATQSLAVHFTNNDDTSNQPTF